MDLVLVTHKQHLLEYRHQILNLFEQCFGGKLPLEVWQWAYIDNPCGDPIVSLCLVEDRLLGHYAVIPLSLTVDDKPLKVVLSMTTMVAPEMRGKRLFTQQAEQVYQHLEQEHYDFVIGFPNSNSLPGFRKHLQWQIAADNYVAKLPGKALMTSKDFIKSVQQKKQIRINHNNAAFLQWRLAKPNVNYQIIDDSIMKPFEDGIDIVYSAKNVIAAIEPEKTYQILLPHSIHDLQQYKAFDYPFGYRAFNHQGKESFKQDLLLSDVF